MIPPPDQETIAARLRSAGVESAHALAALAQTSVRVTTRRFPASDLPLGSSRFGGSPDLPPGFAWPTRDGRPLTFIAQINLTEAQAPDLPRSGSLLFFYDVQEQPWGFDPKDAGGARVVYVTAPIASLNRVEHPVVDALAGPFPTCSLTFTETVDLPDKWDRLLEDCRCKVEEDQWEAYDSVACAISGVAEGSQYHHLLGHPQLVQNDMRGECQLVTNGIYGGDPTGYQTARSAELLSHASREWRLLLQVDTDEDGPDWMWGDCGRIYYWIRNADLEALRFEGAWLILQCG